MRYEEQLRIRIPGDLGDVLDREAGRARVSRSAFVRQILTEKLQVGDRDDDQGRDAGQERAA